MKRKKLEEYIGETYNHLTITGVDRERRKRENSCNTYVFADCDCGVKGKSYNLAKIKKGEIKSCGHLKYLCNRQYKFNKTIHCDDYGIIYANDTPYYYDLEDEYLLDGKFWYKDDYGYLAHAQRVDGKYKYEKFHKLVMRPQKGQYVDHINRQKNDNRKKNLRICNHRENDINKDISKRNTSGFIGVCWDKTRNKWAANLTYHKKTIYLGRYDNIRDAIVARLKGELIYFKEFAPQRHLFQEYLGVKYYEI